MPTSFMPENSTVAGLALMCSPDGVIDSIVYDLAGLSDPFQTGKNLVALLEPGSADKGQIFLEMLRQQGLVINWELNVIVRSVITPMLFVGVNTGSHHLIVVSTTYQSFQDVARIFDDFSNITNEQSNAFRAAVKNLSLQARPVNLAPASDLSAELTSLSREMAGTQQQLEKTAADLQLYQAQFDAIFSALDEGVILTSASGEIRAANPAAQRMLNFMTGDPLQLGQGRRVEQLLLVTEQGKLPPLENPIVTAARENQTVELRDKVVILIRSGVRIPVDVICTPIHVNPDQIAGFALILKDRTPHKLPTA